MDSDPKPTPPLASRPPGLGTMGWLIVGGLVLSLGSLRLLPLPILGPGIGLLLGWVAFRKSRDVPQVDSRALATWVMALSAITLFLTGYLAFNQAKLQSQINDRLRSFLDAVARRDAKGVRDMMTDTYREAHTLEDVSKALQAAVPAGQEKAPEPEQPSQPTAQSVEFEVILPFEQRRVKVFLVLAVRNADQQNFEIRDFQVTPEENTAAPEKAPDKPSGKAEDKPEEQPAAGGSQDGSGTEDDPGEKPR